ncbi:MAG: 30S ribosomal protein S8e [Candidatus Pacearchaeota archaeon]
MSKRKPSGGRKRAYRKKKKFEIKKFLKEIKLGERKAKIIRMRGGNYKVALLRESWANVAKDGKVQKVKILDVLETPANRLLARSQLLMKGAIIKTELGKARITSRPGQDGVVNAVLIE